MDDRILNSVIELFSKKRNIILIPHSSPDADALGAAVLLVLANTGFPSRLIARR